MQAGAKKHDIIEKSITGDAGRWVWCVPTRCHWISQAGFLMACPLQLPTLEAVRRDMDCFKPKALAVGIYWANSRWIRRSWWERNIQKSCIKSYCIIIFGCLEVYE